MLDILGILGMAGSVAKDIRAAITGKEVVDPNKMAEIEAKLLEMENLLLQAQSEVNKVEAAHPSILVAGWRPFVGWVCGSAFAYHFIVAPIVAVVLSVIGKTFPMPVIDIQSLVTVLMGMLGLGLYRSLEKKWGVVSEH